LKTTILSEIYAMAFVAFGLGRSAGTARTLWRRALPGGKSPLYRRLSSTVSTMKQGLPTPEAAPTAEQLRIVALRYAIPVRGVPNYACLLEDLCTYRAAPFLRIR
jgi:hypothetical protein